MIIKNGLVYSETGIFVKEDIGIVNDVFSKDADDSEIIDAEGHYVIPGLVDIHFHGCAGFDFCDGTITAMESIASYEAKNGITTIVPATMTLGDDRLCRIFENASEYTKSNHEGCSDFAGINMEGPYVSKAKKGAQNEAYIHKPDAGHFDRMNKLSGQMIKLVALAPEEPGAMEFIEAVKDKVTISVAHTAANYDIAAKAFELGAAHVTHLYNAMNGFTHRDPGVIGAAFEKKDVNVELICDGVHIVPTAIRATFQLFGADRIVLISDSMMATGLDAGTYALGGQEVTVRGNVATLSDGTIAGSVTNLMNCMKTAVTFGIPLESAVKCATANPAKAVGIYNRYGSISEGKVANLVLLDKELNIISVILRGKKKY